MICNTCANGGFKLISKPHYKGHMVQQVRRWCKELKCYIDWMPDNCRAYKVKTNQQHIINFSIIKGDKLCIL